jgi:hypothetical protein
MSDREPTDWAAFWYEINTRREIRWEHFKYVALIVTLLILVTIAGFLGDPANPGKPTHSNGVKIERTGK